jgi:hypothetical protein
MAPNKLEKYIKENLEERTLTPSPGAWDRLSNRLDAKPHTKQRSLGVNAWLGIAACIVGVILLAIGFGNKDINLETNPVIVNNPQPINVEKSTDLKAIELDKSKAPIIKEPTNVDQIFEIALTNIDEIEDTSAESISEMPNELTFEEQKIQEVVAEIQLLKESNSNVSDSEIDALLLKAQQEIHLNKLYNNKDVVDAALLLQDVEAELDQSFRSKVFEAIKDGFGTVKSAIANRNN